MIHLWWDGPVPADVQPAIDLWRETHDAKLWTNQDPDIIDALAFAQRVIGLVVPIDHVRHRSNVVRYWLLRAHGGIWVDCDTTPLRQLDVDTSEPFTASLGGNCEGSVMGGPADHPFFASLLTTLGQHARPDSPSTLVSGSRHMTLVAAARGDVTLAEPGRFFAITARDEPVELPSDGIRYTTHAWATSRLRLQET